MPLIRTFARQGHAVPKGYQRPFGPFPPEVLAQPKVVYEDNHSDSLHSALDDVRMFRCKECGEILNEYQLDSHDCEEEE